MLSTFIQLIQGCHHFTLRITAINNSPVFINPFRYWVRQEYNLSPPPFHNALLTVWIPSCQRCGCSVLTMWNLRWNAFNCVAELPSHYCLLFRTRLCITNAARLLQGQANEQGEDAAARHRVHQRSADPTAAPPPTLGERINSWLCAATNSTFITDIFLAHIKHANLSWNMWHVKNNVLSTCLATDCISTLSYKSGRYCRCLPEEWESSRARLGHYPDVLRTISSSSMLYSSSNCSF